jgi:peptidyl-prolyl cis-trans isomerase SurA
MKKFFLLFLLSSTAASTFSQTLFTYGRDAVSKDEFLRAYNKNKTPDQDKKTALREYLDLYIKFKLKVKAAHDMKIDTLPGINADLQNFRSQIEENYLNDEKEVNALVEEAFERSQKDIHITHLFIPLSSINNPSDTLKIYKAAEETRNALVEKKGAPGDVLEELKKQGIPASWADVGFITVFSIPYEFENIVYHLQPGELSKVYRSRKGYHIFQNVEERKAAGKMKAAQILIAIPPEATEEQKNNALKLADSVYNALKNGADFTDMAKAVSNDQTTYMNGGVMPEFGTGKYDPVFESKAFALQKDDDITPPFQTSFGYHIVKRMERTPIPEDKNDAEYLSYLKQQVQKDGRISSAKEKFLKQVLKKLTYQKAPVNENELWRITDSFAMRNKKISTASLNEKTLLFTFTGSKVTVGDWMQFAKDYKNNPELYKGETYPELMQKYLSITAFEKYRNKLEYYDADFKYQLDEFKDGNMLFEIMEKNIWSKASNDSAGLLEFYNQNKNKYYWNESADAILVSCANQNVATAAAKQIAGGEPWAQVAVENSLQVQADSGRYELDQLPLNKDAKPAEGSLSDIQVNSDGTATFTKIIHLYPANQPRTFEESRGLVINDYQNFLEDKWIAQLKKKYPVVVNEKVFQSLQD